MTNITNTLPVPMSADIPAVWRSSVPAAVFDHVQVRRILPADNPIELTRETDRADRLLAGTALLANRGITASPEARSVLARGALDLRAATALAASSAL